MKIKTVLNLTLNAVLPLSPLLWSQAISPSQPLTGERSVGALPSVFDYHVAVHSGMAIGNRAFSPNTTISSVALNDIGEVAFVADFGEGTSPAIFTSRRAVARQGDVIEGRYLVALPYDSLVAINNVGQVAFQAWYADTPESGRQPSGLGIFVENHLAATLPLDASGRARAFALTDDGRVVVDTPCPPPSPPPSKPKSNVLDRIRITPPKGFPISIAPSPTQPAAKEQEPAACSASRPPIPQSPTNHRGQIVIPMNLRPGFLILIGTPITH
jgi:hypothetical protein